MYSVLLMATMSMGPVEPSGIIFNRGARASGCGGTEAAGYVETVRVRTRRVRGYAVPAYDSYSNGCSGGFAQGFSYQQSYAPMSFQFQSASCNGGAGGQAVGANFSPYGTFSVPQGTVFLSQSPPPRRFIGWRQCGPNQMCAVFEG